MTGFINEHYTNATPRLVCSMIGIESFSFSMIFLSLDKVELRTSLEALAHSRVGPTFKMRLTFDWELLSCKEFSR